MLRELGWDAVHVSEIGLQRAEDLEILEAARQDHRICVTLDHDFHSHLALTRVDRPSVVFLRIQKLDATGQCALIRAVWETCEQALEDGAAISADNRSVRIRRLPLR